MKKGAILILILATIGVGAYFLFFKKEDKPAGPKQEALKISKNTDSLNQSFGAILTAYYSVKDALVDWDSTKAAASANDLAAQVAAFPVKQIKADAALVQTVQSFLEQLNGNVKSINTEPTLELKRRAFANVSDGLYNIARIIKYDYAPLYKMECPMAFNDEEKGDWISADTAVKNPYLGTKHPKYHSGMLECGSVIDSSANYLK